MCYGSNIKSEKGMVMFLSTTFKAVLFLVLLMACVVSVFALDVIMANYPAVYTASRQSIGDVAGSEYGAYINILNTTDLTIDNVVVEMALEYQHVAGATNFMVCIANANQTGAKRPLFYDWIACGYNDTLPVNDAQYMENFTMNVTPLTLNANTLYSIIFMTEPDSTGRGLYGYHEGAASTWPAGDFYKFTGPYGVPDTWTNLSANNPRFAVYGTLAPVDTCTAPALGNWDVDCSDDCNWIAAQSVPGNMSITGSGTLKLSDVFTFTSSNQYIFIGSGCTLEVQSGGSIE